MHRPLQISLLLLLAWLFAACREEVVVSLSPETDADSGCLVMLVSTDGGEATPATRTPSDGDYNPGFGYENYLDLIGGDYRVLLFDGDNNFVMQPSEIELVPFDPATGISQPFSKTYILNIPLRDGDWTLYKSRFFGSTLKVVLIANWRDYPDSYTTIDALVDAPEAKLAYKPQTPGIDYEHRIPMFGITTAYDARPDGLTAYDLGTLHLLRALAKVEVFSAPGNPPITSAKLTKYNESLLCAPRNVYSPDDYVHGSWALDYTATPTIPASSERHDTPLALKEVSEGHYMAYVPEYQNANRDKSGMTTLTVTFEGFPASYTIEFKDYTTGHPFNIMRNNWYRFEVTKKTEIVVNVDVIPFSEVTLSPDLGLERDDITGYIPVYDRNNPGGPPLYWLDRDGNKWRIQLDGDSHYVFSYDNPLEPEKSKLDHWFDYTGVKHGLTIDDISGFMPVYDTADASKLRYWEERATGSIAHKVWLKQNEYFSVYVFYYENNTVDAEGDSGLEAKPRYWFDFQGNTHSFVDGIDNLHSKNEYETIAPWLHLLSPGS